MYWKSLGLVGATQEASYEYLEREGEKTFLECLDQLEVAFANLEVS